mgnify:CR=1 FL=1
MKYTNPVLRFDIYSGQRKRQGLTNLAADQGAVHDTKCFNCQAPYIDDTGRNLDIKLTENKRATGKKNLSNHITEQTTQ